MSSIMTQMFGKVFGQQAPQPGTPGTPGNIPATTVQASATNPTLPANSAVAPENVNPLDAYKDLFKADPNAPKTTTDPMFNVDPAKLQEAAKQNDFTKVITPEMQAAITAGGEQGMAATIQIMQAMSQKGFADSAQATTKIVEAALAKQQESFLQQLPSIIKKQSLNDNLSSSNPVFSHPGAAPIIDMLKTSVSNKFPNATAQEQQEQLKSYLDNFVAAMTPQSNKSGDVLNKTDWSDFE